jgi:hypothetical protein
MYGRLSREDQGGASTVAARGLNRAKTDRWMQRRSTRKANLAARLWGHDQGLEHEQNPLYFRNRQEYDNIANWLSAMAARDAAEGGALGMAPARGPQGAFEYPHHGPYDSAMDDYSAVGRDIGNVARAVGGWIGNGRINHDDNVRAALGWLYRAATSR